MESNWPIHPVDAAVLVILALSALFAFFRGFVREVLSVLAWIGAAVVAVALLPVGRPYAAEVITNPAIADAAAGVTIFVIALIIFSLIGGLIASQVQKSAIGPLDRSLGLLFGVARGGLVLCIAYLLITRLDASDKDPEWMQQARSLPLVKAASERLYATLPPELRQEGEAAIEAAGQQLDGAARAQQDLQRLQDASRPTPAPGSAQPVPSGYSNEQRQGLEQLYQSQGGGLQNIQPGTNPATQTQGRTEGQSVP
ncbi:CvpA family protein [Zavarzinia sp. CC-PAN008]|uniref:CvpA family protein n=1 Tax=Zavarzinia sp. CC-PAN008 TaxID=3243332 RepID=UPI003F743097